MVYGVHRWPCAAILVASGLSVLSIVGGQAAAQQVPPSATSPQDLEPVDTTVELPTANELRDDTQSSQLLSQSSESDSQSPERTLQAPTEDRVTIGVGDPNAPWSFSYGFGSKIGEPNALQGGTRLRTVSTAGQRAVVFPVAGFAEQGLGIGRRLLLEAVLDPQNFGADLSVAFTPTSIPGQFGINLQNQSSRVGAFENGNDDVELTSGANPWVNRIGGGVEYFQPLNSIVDIAGGVNYQTVSVREGMFTSSVAAVDELGNPVTVSDDGIDPLLTVNVATTIGTLDDASFPTSGTRFRIGLDQSIPVGDASITMSRLSANWSQFIPLNGADDERRAHTLILNVQGGTILGDAPPYEAFSLGGAFSVRGFNSGEIGTGRSYISTAAEYRYPIGSVTLFGQDFSFRGSIFTDFGSTLDSQGAVIGRPGEVRDKDGDGVGYGIGFLARSPIGLFRVEPTFNNRGDFILHFQASDRF
ncbi:MAG: BamA/TamA family outer membrane protein [Cyanobacteria bacterium P01_E01_bin.45]